MRTIAWHLTTNKLGSDISGEFEVEDNTTDDEIEELAKLEAFNWIDWSWWEVKK